MGRVPALYKWPNVGLVAVLLLVTAPGILAASSLGGTHTATTSPWTKAQQVLASALNVSTAAAVHGWVQKAGPVDLQLWHGSFAQERNAQFNRWLKASRFSAEAHQRRRSLATKVGVQPLPEPPPVIFPKCHVFVSHRYKFIYVRHPKTASISILKYFTECNPTDRPRLTPGPACMSQLPADLPAAEVARLFRDYFVFTVVRNPLQRALSSYKFLVGRMVGSGGAACRAGMSWDAYCADPLSLGAICHTTPACCAFPSGFFWHHTLDQARCMVTAAAAPGGREGEGGAEVGWAVDYIARVEHLEEDLEEVFAEIDRRRPPHLPPVTGWRLGWENATPRYCGGVAALPGQDGRPVAAQRGEVWVGMKQLVYQALQPAQRYCRAERYYTGPHAKCMRTLGHYYALDLSLLYGAGRESADVAQAGKVPP
ncbi:hypothetical protein N2152v2_001840 [Parachlorella kessleri]